ncbi:MAG: hypothetical protein JW737_00855 [Acidobacteria bacterium]|nr:hypothetical protein [Acidobacteriota bacterium]
MPIFEQNYRSWDGALKSGGIRWMPIASVGIRQTFKKKKFLFFYLACWVTFIVFAAIMIFRVVAPDQISKISEFLEIGPVFFTRFLAIQNALIWGMTIWVGSNLINEDFKSNALQLYLSKPLSSNDYIFGKISIIAFFIFSISALPALILFILRALILYDPKWLAGNFWLVPSIIVHNLIVALVYSSLILFFSSVTKNSRFSGIGFIIVYIMSSAIAGILYGITRNSLFGHFSLEHNVQNVLALLFGSAGMEIRDDFARYMNPPVSALILIIVSMILFLIIKKKVGKTEVIQ